MIAYVSVTTDKNSSQNLRTEPIKIDLTGYDTLIEQRNYVISQCNSIFINEIIISIEIIKIV